MGSPTHAKTTPPRAARSFVRPHLLARLDPPRRLVWITGPAGSGKTTLVATRVDRADHLVLWYRLDDRDRDLATSFQGLTEAVDALVPGSAAGLPPFTLDELQTPRHYARRYFEALFALVPRPFLIVIDDVHEVADVPGWELVLVAAASALPADVGLIAVGRSPVPGTLARHVVHGELEVIAGEDLNFRREEVEALLRARHHRDGLADWAAEIERLTHGWAAGVFLLIDRANARPGAGLEELDEATLGSYFERDVLSGHSDEETQFLLATSVLPSLDADLATALTGQVDAAERLEKLFRWNIFTRCHPGDPPRYTYHELFRRYLLSRARTIADGLDWQALCGRAIEALVDAERVEEAIEVALAEGLVEDARRLIGKVGPSLERDGRFATLLAWLERIPEELVSRDGELLFWRGVAHRLRYSPRAQTDLEAAYRQHMAAGEPSGAYAAWCEWVEAATWLLTDSGSIDRAYRALDDLTQRFPTPPDDELAFRHAMDKLCILHYRQPTHPDVDATAQRVVELAMGARQVARRAYAGAFLAIHWVVRGVPERAELALRRVVIRPGTLAPALRIPCLYAELYLRWIQADGQAGERLTRNALELIDSSGLEGIRPTIILMEALASLSRGDWQQAETHLTPLLAPPGRFPPVVESTINIVRIWIELLRGRAADAEPIRRRWASTNNLVELPFDTGLLAIAEGIIALEAGHLDEATQPLDRGIELTLAQGAGLHELAGRWAKAVLALETQEPDAARARCAEALALARRRGLYAFFFALPRHLARLCAYALTEGIETDFVTSFIRRRQLLPHVPVSHLPEWPAPLRIRTLGSLSIERDGKPIELGPRPASKPIELLVAVIAWGGTDVPVARLLDAVWPDAEGDAARRVLNTTLHRLRGLLGVDDVLQVSTGQLMLDPARCWVDIQALAHLLDEIDGHTPAGQLEAASERLFDLYRGPFAAALGDPVWALGHRRALASLFESTAERLASHLEAHGREKAAADLKRRARWLLVAPRGHPPDA